MSIDGLRRGAQELLDNYHNSQSAIAKAYVKGDLPKHLEPFVWDVIADHHVADARDRLDRSSWRFEERIAKLEEEVKALQAKARPPSTASPYQPRSLPKR